MVQAVARAADKPLANRGRLSSLAVAVWTPRSVVPPPVPAPVPRQRALPSWRAVSLPYLESQMPVPWAGVAVYLADRRSAAARRGRETKS